MKWPKVVALEAELATVRGELESTKELLWDAENGRDQARKDADAVVSRETTYWREQLEKERTRYDEMVIRLTTAAASPPVVPATVVSHPSPEGQATAKLSEWREAAIVRGMRDIREQMASEGVHLTEEEARAAAEALYDGATLGG